MSKKTHGESKTRLFNIWQKMKQRINNPNNDAYANYGGSGITYHSSWEDFLPFKEWAINNGYKENLTLDRYPDAYGNYEPSNCRWATKLQQSRNKRTRTHSSIYIGITLTKHKTYQASICVEDKRIYLGCYPTELEAAIIRDQYIVDNMLPDYTLNNLKEICYDNLLKARANKSL